MGDSPKWVKSRRRREKKRLNVGNNNGQTMHGACKPPGPKHNFFCSNLINIIKLPLNLKVAQNKKEGRVSNSLRPGLFRFKYDNLFGKIVGKICCKKP